MYTDRERKIFRWADAAGPRLSDPMAVHRRLNEAGGRDWRRHLDTLRAALVPPPPNVAAEFRDKLAADAEAASAELARVTRHAFEVGPYAEPEGKPAGVTEAEALELLAAFLEWDAGVQEAAGPLSTSPPPTGGPAASAPTTPPSTP